MAIREFRTDGQNIPFTVFQIERLYHEAGLTLREIAKRFGVTHQAVHDRLRRAGIPLSKRARRPRPVPLDEGRFGSSTKRKSFRYARLLSGSGPPGPQWTDG